MHYKLIAILLLSASLNQLSGQDYTRKGEHDARAKATLEKMRKKYEAMKTIEADFSLTIEVPEKTTEQQTGKLIQKGRKYRLRLKDRTLVSDGKSAWLYLEKNKEVQINDAEEEAEGSGGISSPGDLLKAYEWDDYIYALTQELQEKGRLVQHIEFKPVAKDAEYAKIRLVIDKNSLDIVSIKSFGKDGIRYTLTINKITPDREVPDATFSFSKKDCPDCRFEDLRLN
jgi:outer membrane lipoprotein-sorting protein